MFAFLIVGIFTPPLVFWFASDVVPDDEATEEFELEFELSFLIRKK